MDGDLHVIQNLFQTIAYLGFLIVCKSCVYKCDVENSALMNYSQRYCWWGWDG